MPDLRPRRILHVDLSTGLPERGVEGPVFLVVWWRDLVLGYAHLSADASATELATRVAQLVAPSVARRILGTSREPRPPGRAPEPNPDFDALRSLEAPLRRLDSALDAGSDHLPTVTVAVCTRNRPDSLERCLQSITSAAPGPDELLVVENGIDGGPTREVVDRFRAARYVAEPRPGLSAARNAAVRESSSEALAFVDDDVVVHPRWLVPLRRGFDDDRVMAVTGLVLPAELETEAQVAFETTHGGLGLGYQRAYYDRSFLRATVAYGMPVWKIGAGANMALRRSAFDLVGDFDERLGAGAAGCSEDSELWYRLIAEGWACRYEPDSVVFHHHRRENAALARQIHDYTRGHVAALFVQFGRFHDPGNLRRALLALPNWFAKRTVREVARRGAESVGLAPPRPVATFRPELAGYLRGLAYAPFAVTPQRPRHKAALRPFLARNPFPRPYTLGFFYREKMRAIHRIAPDCPAREVLEVGGGRSGLARLLYPEAQVTTVDVEEEHGGAEVNRDPRVRFVVADATALPFDDASFDVVTFFDVLEHIPDDARAAKEAMRVLRPGGFVLVTSPSQHWRFPYYRVLAPLCPTDQDMIAEWGHVRRGYAPPDLARLFGRAPVKTAGFITPLTALGHDLAWSKLPESARRALGGLVSPLSWLAYSLQPASRPGTEVAASWRKPDH
jgi:glycosyltransferase involved in cell wall biosynthesis/SAM-dependent methyltransferase